MLNVFMRLPLDRKIRALAGTNVLIGLAIGYFATEWGYAWSTFVGLNLLQSAFTGFCPIEGYFKKLEQKHAPQA